jgi:hypothetical protein
MPVLLSRSECRWGTWHVVTYDISDPQNWIELDSIDTGQPCGTASAEPAPAEARAALFRSMLADPEVLSRWLDHPARFATAMGWCEQGEQIMARTARRMRGGEAGEVPPPPPPPEDIIEGDDEFLADIRDALDRFRGRGGGSGQPAGEASSRGGGTATAAAGAAGTAGVIILEALKAIPWDAVFKAIEDAIKAKKDRDIMLATLKAWERIGGSKDLLLNLLDDPRFTEEQRAQYRAELRPKLSQAQNLASQVRRALEKGDSDDAKRFLKALEDVLRQIRTWIENFKP